MGLSKKYTFSVKIYQIGVNWCVDVPTKITKQMVAEKGRINIKGLINGFDFIKTLMPAKDSAYRLFVNQAMMKGGKTALGQIAHFEIEQDFNKEIKEYTKPKLLSEMLRKNNLTIAFDNLTASRKKDIFKYLNYIKKEETLLKNIDKLIHQLKNKEKNVRIP